MINYAKRKEELEFAALQNLCRNFLKSELVTDENFEMFEGSLPAYKTLNESIFFTPLMNVPVTTKTLRGEKPIPNRFWYSVSIEYCVSGGYHEPDDCDIAEISREESLQSAILSAAKYMMEREFNDACEAEFWNVESQIAKEFPNLLDEH
jgi:hypothetical protein